MIKNSEQVKKILTGALKEDSGKGDITTSILFPGSAAITAEIVSKEAGIVCGIGVVEQLFKMLDKKAYILKKVNEGNRVAPGNVICAITGNLKGVLKGGRIALNLLGRMSGRATLTNEYVRKISPYEAKISDTRKTTPGIRILEKYAVTVGGGYNHRMGLWDQVLIKDNHLALYKKIKAGKEKNTEITEIIRKFGKKAAKDMKVEIEVDNLRDFKNALAARPDIIMLDNMPVSDIIKSVTLRDDFLTLNPQLSIKLEASGGINLSNVKKIAATGVDIISIGALTHSAASLDFSLEVCA